MLIYVNNYKQPILDIDVFNMGLNRDRNPDRDWSELRTTRMDCKSISLVEMTNELKQILLEDLAYAYGQDSIKFTLKLKEFNLI